MNIKSCFVIPKPNPKADLKLICFPYAGGSPHVFVSWVNELSPSVELVIMQAPGRELAYLNSHIRIWIA